LADLNALATKGEDIKKGVVSLIFGTGNPPDVALTFLAGDKHDAEIAKRGATAELLLLLENFFDIALPDREPLAALRIRLGRHVLATDLIATFQGAVPAPLAAVKTASKPAARDACVNLARTWRLRRDVHESYVAAANKVQEELHLAQIDFGMERIVGVETFLAVEKSFLRQVETALLEQPTGELLHLAEAGKSRFWSDARPSLQAHWSLIAAA